VNLRSIRTRLRAAVGIAVLPVLALTACGSGDTPGTTAAGAQASPAPTDDPVAAVR
jgi:polar amino acid transport system substrate-binding protein